MTGIALVSVLNNYYINWFASILRHPVYLIYIYIYICVCVCVCVCV